MKENTGFIKIYRDLVVNEVWFKEKFTEAQAWIDLLFLASFAPHYSTFRTEQRKLLRGEILTNYRKLASRWQWDRRAVQSFMHMYQQNGQLVYQLTSNKNVLISITNYTRYQDNVPTCVPDNVPLSRGVKEGNIRRGSSSNEASPKKEKPSKDSEFSVIHNWLLKTEPGYSERTPREQAGLVTHYQREGTTHA